MRRAKAETSLFMLLSLLLILAVSVGATANLVENASFEAPIQPTTIPGWVVFSNRVGQVMQVKETLAYDGKQSLAFTFDYETGGMGLRSIPVPAKPGEEYEATVFVYASEGSKALFYIDYRDKNNKRIQTRIVSNTQTAEWEKLSNSLVAPEGTATVSLILYTSPKSSGTIHWDMATLQNSAERIAQAQLDEEYELDANAEVLDYAPANDSVVTTNPPAFIWIPVPGAASYIVECSSDPDFTPATTHRFEHIDMSVLRPPVILDMQQTWYWRVYGVTKNGQLTPPTKTRAFRIAQNAAVVPLPDLEEVRNRIPSSHPRLFVTAKTLPKWQTDAQSDPLKRLLWQSVYTKANISLFEMLPNEPPNPRPHGVLDDAVWRQANVSTEKALDTMELLSFAYLMTGDTKLGEAARRWIVHIASWDPAGPTGARINDDISRPLLQKLGRAYTWAYDALTPEDRDLVRRVMQVRGNEAYHILRARPYESRVYASHATGSLSLLGEAAIVFLGEIPEAQEWFDYLVRIFYTVYPPWGGDSGGWSEGHAYWNTAMTKVFWFADALKAVTNLDLYQMPFFKATGDFKLLTHPPYSKMGPFGDHADTAPTSGSSSSMAHLGVVYKNPYYQWYAASLGTPIETALPGFIRANLYERIDAKGQPPVDAPTGAVFTDVGWVVFHRDYVAPQDQRIQFMFKSSPYGSFSHSMADQNSFTLEAYGEPLAISSGYRPWYGSPHHMGWTKTTQAHNAILVNGKGQMVQSLQAKGDIVGFINGQKLSYTAGAAAAAYGGTVLQHYTRHIVYLRPDLFVLFDDLSAPQPSTFSWLFHAYHKVTIDTNAAGFLLQAPQAHLQVKLWGNTPLAYTQTSQFAVPLDREMDKPAQWHLSASTQEAATDGFFLAVMRPLLPHDNSKLEFEKLTLNNGVGTHIRGEKQNSLVLFRQGAGILSAAGLTADGDVAVWFADEDGTQGLLLANGSYWQVHSTAELLANTKLTAEFTFLQHEVIGSLVTDVGPGSKPFTVTVELPGRRVTAVTSSHQLLSWQAVGNTLHMELEPGEHQITIITN